MHGFFIIFPDYPELAYGVQEAPAYRVQPGEQRRGIAFSS
jgi:hypothetical protein